MNIKIFSLFIFSLFTFIKLFSQNKLQLWYKQPAKQWTEALPVGNGRLGAMQYGGVETDTIQLNEESLVGGQNSDDNNPAAGKYIQQIQQLLLNDKNNEAHELAAKYLLATPRNFNSYQTLGNLLIRFPKIQSSTSNYKRSLDIANAISTVEFKSNDIIYKRELFISAPDNSLVMCLSANKKNAISAIFELGRSKDAITKATDNNTLIMDGQLIDAPSEETGPGGKHMKFYTIAKILPVGGVPTSNGQTISVNNADKIIILLTAATDYNFDELTIDRMINPKTKANTILQATAKFSYEQLRQRHLKEYVPKFNNVTFSLKGEEYSYLPTDERLENFKKNTDDLDLVTLYFQYGRYLLLSSSRSPGQLPANLQGIWNKEYEAPWKADYHTNINLQMNYWLAGATNIAETELPLINFVDKLRIPGRVTAKKMYNADGWTAHHSTDVFGKTAPHSGIHWSMSPLAGAWLCLNLWEHYQFTADTVYLRNKLYPIIKEASDFVKSFLIKDKNGHWVTAPSMSPENSFILPNGQKDQLTYAPTIDIVLINALFDACIKAGGILREDKNYLDQLQAVLSKLPPIQVSPKYGIIQEWIKDYEEAEPGHRHISQLVGLHPANIITPEKSDLFIAAKKTLERRLSNGGGHTGWSRAWIINFYARLFEAEKAWENVQALLQKSTLSNLFDTHPPFQIDGNFGGTAGIAEMLLQSQNGYIELLPALPTAWKSGSYSGFVARGAFEISIEWKDGRVINGNLLSKKGNSCTIKYGSKKITLATKKNQQYNLKQLFEL